MIPKSGNRFSDKIMRSDLSTRTEGARRRRDRLTARRRDAHDRQPALVGAIRPEAEDAVDAGEARGRAQYILREPLLAVRLDQRRDQRNRVI